MSKITWRSEHTSVENGGDEVWIAEKFQSNSEIAGSPRNSFRASLGVKTIAGKALNDRGAERLPTSIKLRMAMYRIRESDNVR